MNLTDRQATEMQQAVLERADRYEELDDFEKKTLDAAREDLLAYERKAAAQKRVPYRETPQLTIDNLNRFESMLDGDVDVFGEDIEDKDLVSSTVAGSYLSSKFRQPVEKIYENLPAYQKSLMDIHKSDNFDSALRKDIEETRGKYQTLNEGYQHAFSTAVTSESVIDAFHEFQGKTTGTVDENLSVFYGEAFREAKLAYAENKEDFDNLVAAANRSFDDVKVVGGPATQQLFDMVSALNNIEPENRQLALTYMRESVNADSSVKKVFEERSGQLLREVGGLSPRALTEQAHGIRRAIENNIPLTVMTGQFGNLGTEESKTALRLLSAGPHFNQPIPGWRLASDEERKELYEASQEAGSLISTMMEIENFMTQELSKSDFESPTLNFITEKIIYPSARMTPDMIYFVGSAALGKRGTGMVSPLAGLNKAQTQTASKIASMGLMLKASQSQLKNEHFRGLMQDNPNMDPGAALIISGVSGGTAATLDALSMNFVLSKLPGVNKLLSNWKANGVSSAATSFLLNSTGVVGVETVTELAQDVTRSMTQEMFAAVDESIPDVNLTEDFLETIKSAPDVALAILPFALLGGGEGVRLTNESKISLLDNRAALEAMGFDSDVIDDIEAAETQKEKEEIFGDSYNLGDILAHVQKQIPEGMNIADFMSEGQFQTMEAASETSTKRDEPMIHEKQDERGLVTEYDLELPATAPDAVEITETYSTRDEAIRRASEWYQENGVEALIDPNDVAAKGEARRGSRDESPTTDNGYAPENGVMEMSFQEMGMPNAGRRVVLPSKEALATDTNPTKADVNSTQAIDAFAEVIRTAGGSGAIRSGRLSNRRALGYFKPREDIIRIRTANDIETSAHEAGHALEDNLFGASFDWKTTKMITSKSREELIGMGKALYPKEPHNGWGSEGFAEFFRLYTTDPAQAKEKLPSFFNQFEKILSKYPDTASAVKKAQAIASRFLSQGALKRVSSSIAPTRTPLQKLPEQVKEQVLKAERNFIESAAILRQFVAEARTKGRVEQAEDPYYNFRAWRNTADARVDYMANKGMINFAGQKIGRPLVDAFKLVEGQVDEFMIYLYARRAVAMWTDPKGGRNPGITLEDAEATVEHLDSNQFKQAAQQVYDWNNGVLDYAAQASPTFEAVVEKVRKRDPGFYIPLQRHFSEFDKRIKKGLGGANLVKRLKGSGRRIKDPVESMLAQAKAMVLKGHQKAILDQIVKIANSVPGMGHMVTEVRKDMLPTNHPARVAMDKLEKIAKNFGGSIEIKGTKKQKQAIEELIDEEMITFFSPAVIPPDAEHPIMPIQVGTKTKWFEMDKDLYDTLAGMDLYTLPKALDFFLGAPARTFRMGTTGLNAGFSLVTNPIRDFRTLQLNSQASANTGQLFLSWVGTIWDLFRHTITMGEFSTEWMDLFDRLGVKMAQPLGQDSRPLKSAGRRVKRGGKWSILDTPDYIRELFQFTESAARITEIMAVAKDIGYEPSQPLTAEISAKLANAGKQVTTDFTQAGSWAKVINQAVPFFNATIQGPVSHARALRANPSKFMMRGMMGTALALANWFRNKDEEWWEEMTLEERYIYTYIPIGDELLRIPRAFEADGFFMASTEALMEAWYREEPEQALAWAQKWLSDFIPSGLPVLPKIAAEQLANKDFFFDSPIVPRSEEDVPLGEQAGPYTTNVSIFLSNLYGDDNISPRRIDHAIRSLGGGVAVDLMAVLGRGGDSPINNEFEPSDLFAMGRLFQRGGQVARNPKSIDKLYKMYGESSTRRRSKKGETESQASTRIIVTDAIRAIKDLSDVARQEKNREKRNAIKSEMISIANRALKRNQEIQEEIKQ